MTPAVPIAGAIAGRYRIERLLGHGGMADVYRAVDEDGGKPVALKVVRSTDPELARRLTLEARAVAGFDHPGLVRLLDAGVHDEHAYLVMELVDGPSLAEQLRKGPLAPDRSATLGATLADALGYVHERGVVHRDVKPANVLLGPKARARLGDFGIAQVLDGSSATMTGTTLGTAAYMAPEQLGYHRVGPEADMWSLGAVLLECLTGRRGFEGSPAEVVARRLAGATPSAEGLPTPWRMLLSSMLEADPDRRPRAADVAEMLGAPAFARPFDAPAPTGFPDDTMVMAPGTPVDEAGPATAAIGPPTAIAPPPLPTRPPAPRHDGRRLLVAGVVAGVGLAAALAAWALSGGGSPSGSTTTTTTTTSTTTTAPPTSAAASAALVNDVQQGEANGTLSSGVARTILNDLGVTLADAAQGKSNEVETELGAIEQSITNAASNGQASGAETTTLLADVATLATALNVQTPTTTTAPSGGGDNGQTQAPAKHNH